MTNSELDGNTKSVQKADNKPETERIKRVEKIQELVKKIKESDENIPFPGIRSEAYELMIQTDIAYPDFSTPTDEIVEMCEKQGIKIVLGNHPDSGNVFVLPVDSNDIYMDSFAVHKLEVEHVSNPHLVELIRLTTPKN